MPESTGNPPEVKNGLPDQGFKALTYFFYGTGLQKYGLAPVRFLLWFPQVLLWRFILAPTLNWIAVHTGLQKIPQNTRMLVILGMFVVGLFGLMFVILPIVAGPPNGEEMIYSDLTDLVKARQVGKSVTLNQRHTFLIPDKRFVIFTDLRDRKEKWARVEIQPKDNEPSALEWWDSRGYRVRLTKPFPYSYLVVLILQAAPFFLIQIGLLWVFLGGGLRSIFAERTALKHALSERPPPVRLKDIGGLNKLKKEAQPIIDMLKNPDKYKALGVSMPKGILIIGPPGVGKTLIAVAIAVEAGVTYYYMSGSAFGQPLVGLGRDLVNTVRAHAELNMPAVVIIDEAEAVLGDRNAAGPFEGGERGAITDSVLEWLEDIKKRDLPILMIALTNMPEKIDKAAQRPGRLDKRWILGDADRKGRVEILRIHFNNPFPIPLEEGTDVETLIGKLARITPGFSGATLALLVEAARLEAALTGRTYVTPADFLRVLPGVITRTQESDFTFTAKEREMVNLHEAGHALVAWVTPGAPPARLAIGQPHGDMGGLTVIGDDLKFRLEPKLIANIDVTYGGYAMEKNHYGSVSNGPSGDIHQVTRIARAMIFEWGMGEKTGAINVDALTQVKKDAWMHIPAKIAEEAEREVKKILDDSRDRVIALLAKDGEYYLKVLEIAEALKKEKVIDEDRIRDIVWPLLSDKRKEEIAEMDAVEEEEEEDFQIEELDAAEKEE